MNLPIDVYAVACRLGLGHPRVAACCWGIVTAILTIAKFKPSRHMNFTIFRNSWIHFLDHQPLYIPYADQRDLFLYGPTFAVLIAPLAMLPESVGYVLWMLGMSAALFYAISRLPLSYEGRLLVGGLTLVELVPSLIATQYNVLVAALLLLTFISIERGRVGWAALWIAIGLTTKVYGIVGLAFFPFCRSKVAFVGYSFLWGIVLAALPLLWGWEYALGQYEAWLGILQHKNELNCLAPGQNISFLGLMHKAIYVGSDYSDLWILAPALLIYAVPYLRFSQYQAKGFRWGQAGVTLLFCILFSSGSETSTYVIALPGVGLWFCSRPLSERNYLDLLLLLGSMIVFHDHFRALFPMLVWLKAEWELWTYDYRKIPNHFLLCA